MGAAIACASGRNGGTDPVRDRSPRAGITAGRRDRRRPSSEPSPVTVGRLHVSPTRGTVGGTACGRVDSGSTVDGRIWSDGVGGIEPTDGLRSGGGGTTVGIGGRKRDPHGLAYRANSSAAVVTRNSSPETRCGGSSDVFQICYMSSRADRFEIRHGPTLVIIHDKYQCNYQFLPKLYVAIVCTQELDERIGGASAHANVHMSWTSGISPRSRVGPLRRGFERNIARIGRERLIRGGIVDGE